MTKRILILMSKTGGGHRASAQALKFGFQQLYPGQFQVDVIDLLTDYLPWPVKTAPTTYDFLSSKTPWLWKLLYEATDDTIPTLDSTAGRALSRSVERAFIDFAPDLVLSVHPLAQHVSIRALRRLHARIAFVTVITDLATMHPVWFHPDVDCCFVPTEEAVLIARRYGLSRERIRMLGLPLRPAFAQLPEPGAALRELLQMDTELPAALVYGGGQSTSRITRIVEELDVALNDHGKPLGQIVVICGQDGKLQPALAARRWSVPLRSLGYIGNMHEWMTACDCIITKAGPGAIAESMVCGLPMILNAYIPGQEAGNVPYVVDHGIGVYRKHSAEIAAAVLHWFGDGRAERQQISERARTLGNPTATFDIVHEIVSLLSRYTQAA